MPFPKISIITPSLNQGEYIEQTILSVLEQGYPNLEYIIIDGGSKDQSVEIIRKYERHLAYWVSEKDKGQSDAINKGIVKATGDVINWLNSDDYYEAGTLKHVSQHFTDDKVKAYCGRSRIFGQGQERFSRGTDIYENNLSKTIGWARIDQPETFFRKSVWDKVGLLNEDFHYIMDKEWWVRYLLHYGLNGIKKDDKVLVNFRIHDQSKTGSQSENFKQETLDLFFSLAKKADLFFETHMLGKPSLRMLHGYKDLNKELLKTSLNYFLLYVVLEAYAKDNFSKAKEITATIDKKQLAYEDLAELKKVLFRMKWMPVSFKKSLNRWRGKA